MPLGPQWWEEMVERKALLCSEKQRDGDEKEGLKDVGKNISKPTVYITEPFKELLGLVLPLLPIITFCKLID